MNDTDKPNPNVLWSDPAGNLPTLIRAEQRGSGIDRRGQEQRKTRAVVLSEAMDGAFQLVEDGAFDLPGTLARLLALDAELEALEAKTDRAIQLADGVAGDAAQAVGNLHRRVERLEEHHGEHIRAAGEEHTRKVGSAVEGLERRVRELEAARLLFVPTSEAERESWAARDSLEELATEDNPVSARATHAGGGAQVERRITERRTEPYRCQHPGCGAPLEVRGHSGLGAQIFACTDAEDCGRMDSRRNPQNDRRGAHLVRCVAHDGRPCSRKTSNPMWSGWRWARTDTDDPERGGWLCPDDRDGSIPGEIRRCGVCTTWTPVDQLVEGTAADGSSAPVCKVCGMGAES